MAAALGRGLTVERVRRLGGGLGSATSAVDFRGSNHTSRVVLKRYPVGDDTPLLEWERLRFAQDLDVPSPQPLAVDSGGEWFGSPAIVMSRLPGRPSLMPADLDRWMREIAEALVKIESSDPTRAEGALLRPHAVEKWERPDASAWGPLFQRAVDVVESMLPKRKYRRVICHADFHPGNMLFQRDRLTGLVDWSGTRVGPRSFDLSYCRTEVALLFGSEASDQIRSVYESVGGTLASELPLWDLMCALGARRWSHTWLGAYREQGRRDLTLRQFRSRLRVFTERALSEL